MTTRGRATRCRLVLAGSGPLRVLSDALAENFLD
jgi:hypothetical protein